MTSKRQDARKISLTERALILATAMLASYQIAVGIEGRGLVPVGLYTIAFGLILVTALVSIVVENGLLEKRSAHVAAAIVPLALSLGLSVEYHPPYFPVCLILWLTALLGLLLAASGRSSATGSLALVYTATGAIIVLITLFESIQGVAPRRALWVACTGAILLIEGLWLAGRLRTQNPETSPELSLRVYLLLAFLISATTALGFAA